MNTNRIAATWRILHTRPLLKRIYHTLKIELAMLYLNRFPKIDVIAVAGSVGKTTTKEAIASVLLQQYKIKYSIANLDPIFNIPRTILSLRPGDQKLLLEIGIEYKGDMDYFLSLVKPHVVVVTRLTLEHPQFLGSIDDIVADESKIVTRLTQNDVAVLNFDDETVKELAAQTKAIVLSYGVVDQDCTVCAFNFGETDLGSLFDIKVTNRQTRINWKLVGKHSVSAGLAAVVVGNYYGMSIDTIKEGLESLTPPPNRMNLIRYNEATIINDTYNAMPAAMLAALDTLADYKKRGRILAVLATMKELGPYAEQVHRDVGAKVAAIDPAKAIVWGENTNYIADEAVKKGYDQAKLTQAQSYDQVLQWVKDNLQPHDTLLIKGSRHHIHLERIALALQGKDTNIHCPICPECV